MATVSPTPKFQAFDANGAPLVGGKLYTYAAGTTTPQVTYTSSSGLVPNVNPVILDSRGEANVWLSSAQYKFVLKTSTDVEVWTVDNLAGSATQAALDALDIELTGLITTLQSNLAGATGSSMIGYEQAGSGAVLQTVQTVLRKKIYVTDFGAVGNGVTDDTAAFNLALQQANARGGDTVWVPPGRYLITPITLPAQTNLSGTVEGPFTGQYGLSGRAPTILTTSTTGPLITIQEYKSSVTDLLFYYPSQVAPNAAGVDLSGPITYPSTIVIKKNSSTYQGNGNCVKRCTFANAYLGIDVAIGRVMIQDCFFGCYYRSIRVAGAYDWVVITNTLHQVFWDEFAGLQWPQAIDTWVMNNSAAIEIGKADSINIDNFLVFSRNTGVSFVQLANQYPTPGESLTETVGYGRLTNIDLDYVVIGVYAGASNTVGNGYKIVNMDVSANPGGATSPGPAGAYSMLLNSGAPAGKEPIVQWTGGSVRGTWTGTLYPTVNAGEASVYDVIGLSDRNALGAYTPSVPASGVGVKNPTSCRVRVFLIATSGMTGVTINGSGIGITAGNPQTYLSLTLAPGDTIVVTYAGTLQWAWFTAD